MDNLIISDCLECTQLKETFKRATIELVQHQQGACCVKNVDYIHKEAQLYEANNRARRAWNEHREKVHEGMAFA
jgi:hypothetical protein